jgi:pimeloyl-ACP methyl ester carboxylesterase
MFSLPGAVASSISSLHLVKSTFFSQGEQRQMPLQFQLAPAEQIIAGPAGIDLSIETHGDISSPLAIVLIHGGYQSRRCFKYQYPTLAFDHFVVGLDLPGHGRSTLPEGAILSSVLYAECVHAVLTALHLEKKSMVLLGWSFGGLVCRAYLDHFGREMKIVGLIQLASLFGGFAAYLSSLERDPFFQPVLTSFANAAGGSETIAHKRFVTHFFERLALTTSRLDEDTVDAITGYNERAWRNFLPRGNVFLQDLSSSDDTVNALKTLTLSTLLLHGKEDALVPLSFSHVMHRLLPHAELIEIDRCGHSAMLEQPEVVNREIGGFLANLARV